MFGWKLIKERNYEAMSREIDHLDDIIEDVSQRLDDQIKACMSLVDRNVELQNQIPARDKKTGRFIKRGLQEKG